MYNNCMAMGPWVSAVNWTDPNIDVCTWEFIKCYNLRVLNLVMPANNFACGNSSFRLPHFTEQLALSSNHLTNFPTHIETQLYLSSFDVSNNSIASTFPATFAKVATLKSLDCSHNSIQGELPSVLSRLVQLGNFNVEGNQLTGFLPDDFNELPIGSIAAANNYFACPLPNWTSVRSMTCVNVSVTGLAPVTIPSGRPVTVLLSGQNFQYVANASCSFGGQPAVMSRVLSPTEISCTAPALIPGSIEVSVFRGSKQISTNAVTIHYTSYCQVNTYARWTDIASYNSTCEACPVGAMCAGGTSVPLAVAGYVRSDTENEVFIKCPRPSVCYGEVNVTASYQARQLTQEDMRDVTVIEGRETMDNTTFAAKRVCSAGHYGHTCSFCTNSTYPQGGYCVTCDAATSARLFIFLILGVFVGGGFLCVLATRAFRFASTTILLFFMQVTGLFIHYDFPWPPVLRQVLAIYSSSDFNLDLFGLECSFNITYYDRFLVLLISPIILLVVFALYYACIMAYGRWRNYNFGKHSSRTINFLTDSWLLYLSFISIPACAAVFRHFECISDGERYYIQSQPQVTCYTAQYNASLPQVYLLFVLFGCGIPLLFIAITYRHFRKNELHNPQVLEKYGSIYQIYREKLFFWESFMFIFHILLTGSPLFFKHEPQKQVVVLCLTMMALGGIVYLAQPYSFRRSNRMMFLSMMSMCLFLVTGLVYDHGTDDPTFFIATTLAVHHLVFLTLVHTLLYEIQYTYYHFWVRYSSSTVAY